MAQCIVEQVRAVSIRVPSIVRPISSQPLGVVFMEKIDDLSLALGRESRNQIGQTVVVARNDVNRPVFIGIDAEARRHVVPPPGRGFIKIPDVQGQALNGEREGGRGQAREFKIPIIGPHPLQQIPVGPSQMKCPADLLSGKGCHRVPPCQGLAEAALVQQSVHLVPLDLKGAQRRHKIVQVADAVDKNGENGSAVIMVPSPPGPALDPAPGGNTGIAGAGEHFLVGRDQHPFDAVDAFRQAQGGVKEGRYVRLAVFCAAMQAGVETDMVRGQIRDGQLPESFKTVAIGHDVGPQGGGLRAGGFKPGKIVAQR